LRLMEVVLSEMGRGVSYKRPIRYKLSFSMSWLRKYMWQSILEVCGGKSDNEFERSFLQIDLPGIVPKEVRIISAMTAQ
jgi:hypothetical protein